MTNLTEHVHVLTVARQCQPSFQACPSTKMPPTLGSEPFGESITQSKQDHNTRALRSVNLHLKAEHTATMIVIQNLYGHLANNALRVVFVVMVVASIVFTGLSWNVPIVSSSVHPVHFRQQGSHVRSPSACTMSSPP